jgi:hypothetical protein
MKSVVIYTYFSSPSSDYNLDFFVKRELSYKENIDYIIVINGFLYNSNIKFPKLKNLKIISRENIGYDFGGHACALNHLDQISKTYDYYFFMNSGVIGPFLLPSFEEPHWSNVFIKKINDKIKLVGTTVVCLSSTDPYGFGPNVEGFFFMVDKIGLDILKNKKTIFCNHKNKLSAVINGEYGMAKCIFDNGYSIDCMLPQYQNIDWTDPANHSVNNYMNPSRHNSFYGTSINPYDVIFHKWYWHGCPTVNYHIVKQYVDQFNETLMSK